MGEGFDNMVKMAEGEECLEAEVAYPITCGDSKANLIWRKFVCPGINVKCVQYDNHLISPKEFVHLAGKSTLKDWKRAIRMNGIMLRKIMDSGKLDFYEHTKVCSNTCRSTKIDLTGARVSLSSQTSAEYTPLTPASADVNGSPATITIETCEDTTEWTTAIGDDAFTFWRGLRDAGLLEEVVQEFSAEFMEAMKGLQQRIQELPLQLNALEQQCDEHRKRAKELKHKSQHLNNVLMTLTPVSIPSPLKRPRLTRATSGPPAITSQVLTQSAQIALAPGMPITQLAGLPIGKVLSALPASAFGKATTQVTSAGSPASPLLGGYTILASAGSAFPNTVEIHPETSNLTVLSTAAIQDSSTVVKVVSPFQLLTLPGLGTAIQNVTQVSPGGSTILALPSGVVEGASATEEHTTIEVTTVADEPQQK
ncbi:hypothetical protein E2320_009480 [Naja naja]|nr:hypothetical protein E2320_009480 [Naja naja]